MICRSLLAPAARTSGVLGLVIGLSTTMLVAVGQDDPVGSAELLPVAAALGVALVVTAVAQLARRDRTRLTASFTFGVLVAALAVVPVFWLALWSDRRARPSSLLGLAGAATAAAFAVFPGPHLARRRVVEGPARG
jgi:drug/metabolite transporter (DMT)-like permease